MISDWLVGYTAWYTWWFGHQQTGDLAACVACNTQIEVGKTMVNQCKTDWRSGTFFTFPYIGNNHPNWKKKKSDGLKWNHQPENNGKSLSNPMKRVLLNAFPICFGAMLNVLVPWPSSLQKHRLRERCHSCGTPNHKRISIGMIYFWIYHIVFRNHDEDTFELFQIIYIPIPSDYQTWRAGKWTIEISDFPS